MQVKHTVRIVRDKRMNPEPAITSITKLPPAGPPRVGDGRYGAKVSAVLAYIDQNPGETAMQIFKRSGIFSHSGNAQTALRRLALNGRLRRKMFNYTYCYYPWNYRFSDDPVASSPLKSKKPSSRFAQVEAYLRQHPGSTSTELEKALKGLYAPRSLTAQLITYSRSGRVKYQQDSLQVARRYYMPDTPIVEVAETPPETKAEVEQEVIQLPAASNPKIELRDKIKALAKDYFWEENATVSLKGFIEWLDK